MTTPQISLVAYGSRDDRVFVKVPDERGRYMLVEPCVVLVSCPNCKSTAGEPCKGAGNKYVVTVCFARRNKAHAVHGRGYKAQGLDQDDTPSRSSKPRVKLVLSGKSQVN